MILALDQGTTSSRAIIFDEDSRIVSLAQKEFRQIYPQPGWVEHDPQEIWSSQLSVAVEAMAKGSVAVAEIKALAITNQRETTIVWDKDTGEPIHPAIVWQCRRTAEKIEELEAAGLGPHIRAATGLIPDAYFSATKIAWLLDRVPDARSRAEAGELLFGTVDTWLLWKLTGGRVHATDYTNASRTMIFDIHRLCWDEKILAALNIPAVMLPTVHLSGHHFGITAPHLLGAPIPICGIAGDQQAALFGQCCFEKGSVKNTYGTGCFLLMNTKETPINSRHGLITTLAATTGSVEYALEGSVFVAGAAVQWLRDGLRMIDHAAATSQYAERVPDTAGAYLIPAFTGLGAPYWKPHARGMLVGLSRGFSKEHMIRATLEAIAYQTADILRAMEEDAGTKITGLKVDGGASANDFLMQFTADILDTSVLRPACIETTALGAAYLAGLTVGVWADTAEIQGKWKEGLNFSPACSPARRAALLAGWKKAVTCALAWEA